MKKVSTKRKVRFYDDRGKADEYIYLLNVLWESESLCLCEVNEAYYEGDEPVVLFNKETGEVLTRNLEFWYAENYSGS